MLGKALVLMLVWLAASSVVAGIRLYLGDATWWQSATWSAWEVYGVLMVVGAPLYLISHWVHLRRCRDRRNEKTSSHV
jgi:uncharacterized membrane protein YcjF (UPF0283 family)